jgi:hypothetical protein
VLLNRAGDCAAGRGAPNTQIFRELAARMGFDEPCFADSDEALAARPSAKRSTSTSCWNRAGCQLPLPDAPFAEGGFPHAQRQGEFFATLAAPGLDGLPDHVPNHETRAARLAAVPAGDDLAAGAQLPQLHLRQRASLRSIEGEPLLEIHPDDAARAASPTARGAGVQRPRQLPLQGRCQRTRAPRRGQRPGHLVAQAGLDGTNVNELTSQR